MKFLLSLILSLAFFSSTAQDVFQDYLRARYPSCFTPDGSGGWILDPNCPAIVNEDSLEFHNITTDSNPLNLTPLQYFTSLVYLNFSDNYVVGDLPQLSPVLKYLNVNNTNLTFDFRLTAFPASLVYFSCSGNYWQNVPALPASLKYFNCSTNWFYSLPALPPALDTLICNNQNDRYLTGSPHTLSSLPAIPASLKYLNCSENELGSLPSLPNGLAYLNCSNQYSGNINCVMSYGKTLTTLPLLPASLKYLDCSKNKLSFLPFLPNALLYLDCSGSRYADPVTGCEQYFNAGINALPALPAGLTELNCLNSNIICLPPLPSSLITITLDRDHITCLPNAGTYTVLPAGAVIPQCGITYNSQQCIASAIFTGDIFYDYNSNGVKDANENYAENISLQLSSGLAAYTSNNGHYQLWSLAGNQVLTVNPPAYYNAVPPVMNYNVTNLNSSYYQLVALQPNTVIDSVRISIIPSTPVRPGGDLSYIIKYENIGTTILDVDVVLNYPASVLIYSSSTNPQIINTGNQLTLHVTGLTPGIQQTFTSNFNIAFTVLPGDTIPASASITGGSSSAGSNTYSVVRTSYDPNDKQATPFLTVQQVSAGTFIDYLVRFQNTGTDTAFNIVILDTLNAQLNASSFEMISASHEAKVMRKNNTLAFVFNDILLPDSNTNKALSHGYILFRVKPNTNVGAISVIPNKASIYFDYNFEVLTNTANTVIPLTPVPVKLISFRAYAGENNDANLLWTTAEEINTVRFEIEKSFDAVSFIKVGILNARGSGSDYTFKTTMDASLLYFRLKIFDADGQFSYSHVVRVRKNTKAIVLLLNPVKEKLNLRISGGLLPSDAVILNASGQAVMKSTLRNESESINISALSRGVYILKVKNEQVKFVVE